MDPKLDSKELFRALVDVLDYGLYHDLVEDSERVLAALRAMRRPAAGALGSGRISQLPAGCGWA